MIRPYMCTKKEFTIKNMLCFIKKKLKVKEIHVRKENGKF